MFHLTGSARIQYSRVPAFLLAAAAVAPAFEEPSALRHLRGNGNPGGELRQVRRLVHGELVTGERAEEDGPAAGEEVSAIELHRVHVG